jgi:hypothetical protein
MDLQLVNYIDNLKQSNQYKITNCDILTAMVQVQLMIREYTEHIPNVFSGVKPIFSNANLKLVVAFLYSEELNNIVTFPEKYTKELKLSLMNEIADGILNYANVFKENPQEAETYNLYLSISKFVRIFPIFSFQCLANKIISECKDNDSCELYTTVDPTHTESKATTTGKTKNYRNNPPVLVV